MHITKEDVYIVLGWPNGGQKIECNNSNKDRILLEEWRLKFGRKDGKITAGDVVEKMLMCKEGGEWFIRHFMVFYVDRVAVYTRLGAEQLIVMVNTMDDDAQEHESSANESDAPVDLVVEDSEESMLLDDNPIWSSPEVIAAVDLAEKATQVRAKYHEVVSDMPSFSLGMTQEYKGDGCGITSIEHDGKKIDVGSLNTEVTPLRVCEMAVVESAEGGKSNPFNNSKKDENDQNEDVGGMKRKSEERYTHEGNAYEADVAYKLFCDAIKYGWSSTSPCNVDLSNRFEILNSSSENVSFDDKYDGMPKDIGDMVICFFNEKGLGAKVLKLKGQAAHRLEMPWREAKTIHDYGVTTMRHFETYMGQSLRKWECGLTRVIRNR
ncbi:unnamed protein product [Cuscuta campestris]|uniref:Uncharacterized protein n=1 Tax=Cuscuta campestris TaxID=132261 RepID=A0A484N2G1_9ASTE|nr:unnamed protein product [Cuscuta campestris]